MIGIYKITSPSKRFYIGQSVNIEKRFCSYKRLGCKGQPKLYNSFKKYGVENHTFEIIQECDVSELNDLERYYQDLYCVLVNGLNLKLTKCSDRSGHHSIESASRKNRFIINDEIRLKIKIANTGKKRDKQSCINISNAKKGDKNPMFGMKHKKESIDKQIEKVSGVNNYLYKPIINLSTGIFYDTLQEASDCIGIKRQTLWSQLSGKNKNKTPFSYA